MSICAALFSMASRLTNHSGSSDVIEVIRADENCHRDRCLFYDNRLESRVNLQLASPLWFAEVIRSVCDWSGRNSDITNYKMWLHTSKALIHNLLDHFTMGGISCLYSYCINGFTRNPFRNTCQWNYWRNVFVWSSKWWIHQIFSAVYKFTSGKDCSNFLKKCLLEKNRQNSWLIDQILSAVYTFISKNAVSSHWKTLL